MTAGTESSPIVYEPDDRCSARLSLGVSLQGMLLLLPTIVVVVAVTVRAGGQGDSYLSWALFASLIIAGVLTALQASRVGRFGGGHILMVGPSVNFVSVAALALDAGGPGLLASLIVASSLFYLMLALWLPLLRRIITPAVTGTVLMLIAQSVLPIALARIEEVPEGASRAAGPVAALVTLTMMTLLHLRAPRRWRPWSPLASIAAGCVVAAVLGLYEVDRVGDAEWFGIPDGWSAELDLGLGLDFWTLLPAFVVVTLVGGIKNMGDSVAVQQASWRRSRVPDFRLVQGSLNTNGLGILFSGLAGTPPTTIHASASVTLVTMTAVAARRVGYYVGALIGAVALSPKFLAVLLSIPSPVMGAYVLIAIGMLVVSGIRTLVRDGLDPRDAMVVAVSFTVGAGLEQQTFFGDLLGGSWSPLLDNGVATGALIAVALTLFVEATRPVRQARLQVDLTLASLPEIDEFLSSVATRIGWNDAAARRLRSAGEETLISLTDPDDFTAAAESDDGSREGQAQLIIVVHPDEDLVEMEFLAVFDEENLEDRLAYLGDEAEGARGREAGEISLRLLRHYASSVQHQKYHGLDVVTVQVRGSR